MNNIPLKTSLGFSIVEQENLWVLDLTNLRVFKGLSVLSSILGDLIIEKIETSQGDISILYKINPNINPELVDMHIFYIQVYARSGVLNEVLSIKDEFHYQLRTVFGTFQRPTWGKLIHPEFYGEDPTISMPKALVFPFHYSSEKEEVDYQFILERAESTGSLKEFFLRLTIERHYKESINLKSLPYAVVDDLKVRTYIAGSTRISEALNDRIQTACSRGLTQYSEDYRNYSTLFEQLEKTNIGKLDSVNFYWNKNFTTFILREQPGSNVRFIKKLLLVIEDSLICSGLLMGKELKVVIGSIYVVLYLSHLNRVLNFAINCERKKFSTDIYLKRMPLLESLALQKDHSLSFRGIKVFLVHHITSEIIALIETFRKLQATSLSVAFVKYGGVVPTDYLNALLDLPKDEIFMLGLVRKLTDSEHEYYSLADYYSEVQEYSILKKYLEEKKFKYMEAMKLLVGNMFLKTCIEAKEKRQPVLLIEDGGYLAPFLNEYSLMGKTVSEVFKLYLLGSDNTSKFSDWIKDILIGTIEHTRNGYDRLEKVQTDFSKLFKPAYSIAVSKNKIVIEAKEVAHSILSAIESILHSQGLILSSRNIIVLGSDGNIGKFLLEYLKPGRLEPKEDNLIGVDIKYHSEHCKHSVLMYRTLNDIPKDVFYSLDLFIGVIGESILKDSNIEELILYGNKPKLFFASGSTKNLEFLHLANWIESVMETNEIAGFSVSSEYSRTYDPQTGLELGGKLVLKFDTTSKTDLQKNLPYLEKTIYLLGDLTPINFLYYGVPTETMDIIISDLTTVSLGMVDQFKQNKLPSPLVYGVDISIDSWGNAL
jgi:hypothetical protein